MQNKDIWDPLNFCYFKSIFLHLFLFANFTYHHEKTKTLVKDGHFPDEFNISFPVDCRSRQILRSTYLPVRFQELQGLKSVHIPSYSGPLFSRIRTEYGEILNEGTSCQMKENTGQNNSKYGHFLRNIEIQE